MKGVTNPPFEIFKVKLEDSGLVFFLSGFMEAVYVVLWGDSRDPVAFQFLCLYRGLLKFGCWEEALLSGTCRGFPNLYYLQILLFSHGILAWLVVKSQGRALMLQKKKKKNVFISNL